MIRYNYVHPLKSWKYNAGCHAVEVAGKYDVYCVDCGYFIGRMGGEDVQRAIMITAGRGGVKCPSCRATTCDECGSRVRGELSNGPLAGSKLCWFCVEERVVSKEGLT